MKKRLVAVGLVSLLLGSAASADEGMWLYNAPPKKQLESKYNFKLTQPWMEHLRLSSVRFNNGGSGSFVSDQGLVLTNHHVGADAIQKLSTEGSDLIKTGFLAKSRDQELPTKDLELNVLYEIVDVTDKVKGAATKDMSAEQAEAAVQPYLDRVPKKTFFDSRFKS